MRVKSHGTGAFLANPAPAIFGGGKRGFYAKIGGENLALWRAIVSLFRRRHPDKTAALIAAWTKHPLRTVEHWMAGETVPGIDVGFDLITKTGHGPAIIELIARSLPPKERAAFFLDLMTVAERAYHQAKIDGMTPR